MKKIRVMLAEDNVLYLKGLITILEANEQILLSGIASNGRELLQKIQSEGTPDVVLTDIQMPVVDGIELTRKLTKSYPALPVIALTMFTADCFIVDMLEAGARGYLDKNVSEKQIFDAIRTVHEGRYYHCPTTTMKLSRLIAASGARLGIDKAEFTDVEIEVIRYVCDQYSNKQIAGLIHYSAYAVDKVRKRIMSKMGVKGTAGLVIYALRNGIYKE